MATAESIDRAILTSTSPTLNGEANVQSNIQLCDLINTNPGLAHHVVQTTMRRAEHKDHYIGTSSLFLLETLMKNCPICHQIMNDPKLMDRLIHVLPKKIRKPNSTNRLSIDFHRKDVYSIPAIERFDKVLLLIQSWAIAFRNERFSVYYDTFRQLQRNGVHFPDVQPTNESLMIHTPAENQHVIEERNKSRDSSRRSSMASSNVSSTSVSHSNSPTIVPSQHPQSNHLSSSSSTTSSFFPIKQRHFQDQECSITASGCNILGEMINATESCQECRDNALINELITGILSAQSSIQKRLIQNQAEHILNELLQTNDMLTDIIKYHQQVCSGQIDAAKRHQISKVRSPIRTANHSGHHISASTASNLNVSAPVLPDYDSLNHEPATKSSSIRSPQHQASKSTISASSHTKSNSTLPFASSDFFSSGQNNSNPALSVDADSNQSSSSKPARSSLKSSTSSQQQQHTSSSKRVSFDNTHMTQKTPFDDEDDSIQNSNNHEQQQNNKQQQKQQQNNQQQEQLESDPFLQLAKRDSKSKNVAAPNSVNNSQNQNNSKQNEDDLLTNIEKMALA